MRRYNLKTFRERQKLTQEEMAKELKIAKSTYVAIELGKSNPSFGLIEKFSNKFNCENVWDLFKKFQ